MHKIWFTSDHHFGHNGIIQYAGRPFENVEEMDETMIRKWNEKVNDKDAVYYLGDFALHRPERLKEILKRLNGSIYLITGNHEVSALACKKRFEWVKDYYELKVNDDTVKGGKQKIVLFHYSIRNWNGKGKGSFHLYGHAHGTLEEDMNSLSFDIGVDNHDFYPLEYQEVKAIMLKKESALQIIRRDPTESTSIENLL